MDGVELIDFGMNNGSIAFIPQVDARPARSTVGNVTAISEETEEVPAHYEATFMLQSLFKAANEVTFSNVFHLTVVVPDTSISALYRDVEDRSAQQLAPMLRALADRIEADIREIGTGR